MSERCPWCDKKLAAHSLVFKTVKMPRSPDHPSFHISKFDFKRKVVSREPAWRHQSYRPFCTLRCALAFAQASYRGGFRRVRKEAA